MNFDDLFAADSRREDGAWVRDGFRDLPGLALKVRGDGNALQTALAVDLWAAVPAGDRAKPETAEGIETRLILDTILIDWNIGDRAFDREAAEKALTSKTFRDAVAYASRVVASRGVASIEADSGN